MSPDKAARGGESGVGGDRPSVAAVEDRATAIRPPPSVPGHPFSDLLGKPFQDMGRGPNAFDCWGVYLEVNRRLGRALPDYHDLLSPDDADGILGEYALHRAEWEPVDRPAAGDLVVIKRTAGGGLHFGVMIDDRRFAHTTRGSGVHFENIDHPVRKRLIQGVYRRMTVSPPHAPPLAPRASRQYTLTSIPYAIQPREKRSGKVPLPPAVAVTVADAVREVRDQWAARGITDIVVTRNGHYVAEPYSELVRPGDYIGISAKHGVEWIAGWIWIGLMNVGLYGTVLNVAAYALAGAVIVGAGIMINTIMGMPKTDAGGSGKMASPSYGFGGANPVAAGTPVPDVFGVVRSTPPLIGAWREVASDYSMWQHMLFVVHSGQSNNGLTIDTVYVGDELLSTLADYKFGYTDGSMSPDADQIPEFDNIRHDRAFDRVLVYNETVTIASNGDCDALTLIVEFPNGLFAIGEDDGEIYGYTVEISVDYQPTGGGTVHYDSLTCHTDGVTSTVRFTKSITFPDRGKWTVSITRDTADDPVEDSLTRSTCYLASFQEVLFLGQTHPGMLAAQVSIKASDRVSGQVPRISMVHNRTAVTVRDWDDDGTQYAYVQNPMWAAYRMMTDPYNGMNISPLKLVAAAWGDWGDWCEASVGGYQRCQCNLVIDTIGDFGANGLSYIEDVGRAKIVQYGDLWSVIVDKPKDPVYLFSAGNMRDFVWESYEDPEKVDAVEIVYWDKDKLFSRRSVMAKASWFESLTTQPRVATIELRACNNAEQATREALFRMQKTEFITRHGSFTTGLEAMFVERGDVIEIIHPTNAYGFGGRLARDHTAATTIYLDQVVTLPAADYDGEATLYLVNPDGERETRTVTGPWDVETQSVTIDDPYTGYRFDTFAIGRPNQERLAYQVVDKRLAPAKEREAERLQIDFVEYVEAVFYNAAYGSGLVAI